MIKTRVKNPYPSTGLALPTQGLWLAHLKGPGTVYIQSLALPKLAHSLMPYLPQNGGQGGSGNLTSMAVGGILGSLISRDE